MLTRKIPNSSKYLISVALTLAYLFQAHICSAQVVYVADQALDSVISVNADGTNSSTLISGLTSPQGIAINPGNGHLFLADSGTSQYLRFDLSDGGSRTVLLPSTLNSEVLENPNALTLDLVNNVFYYAHGFTLDCIHRTNLTATSKEQNLLVADGIEGVAVDPNNNFLFWTRDSLGQIFRGALDATGASAIVSNAGTPNAIAVDTTNGFIFWTDLNGFIRRAQTNGNNAQIIVSLGTGVQSLGIDVDETAGKVYWTESTRVRRSNLDGSNVETVLSGLLAASGIAVLEASETVKAPKLFPGTTIEDPPQVSVQGNTATFSLKQFRGVGGNLKTSAFKLDEGFIFDALKNDTHNLGGLKLPARSKFTFRYDVRVTGATSKDSRRKSSKKSTVTLKGLRAGTYSAKYRAEIYKLRPAAQQRKLKARGKKGFNVKFKKQRSTPYSPEAQFTVS